jgi:hypothetical protein
MSKFSITRRLNDGYIVSYQGAQHLAIDDADLADLAAAVSSTLAANTKGIAPPPAGVVRMYRAIDAHDGRDSMFAVCGDEMATSFYNGDLDSWSKPAEFVFSKWMHEPLNLARIQNPVLLWEKAP